MSKSQTKSRLVSDPQKLTAMDSAPSSPSSTASTVVSDHETPKVTSLYWPRLKEILRSDPSKFHQLDLTCVCLEPMTIFEKDHVKQHVQDPAFGSLTHGAHILPCGHIFGESCIINTWLSAWDRGQKPSCPACRYMIPHHRLCHHRMNSLPMPESLAEIKNFPVTGGEPVLTPEGHPVLTEEGKVKIMLPEEVAASGLCGNCIIGDEVRNLSSMAQNHLPRMVLHPGEFLGISATWKGTMWWPTMDGYCPAPVVQSFAPFGELEGMCERSQRSLAENRLRMWRSVDLRDLEYELHILMDVRYALRDPGSKSVVAMGE